MTINSTTNRAAYTGNGVTTAFSFPYYFLANADLVVIETVIATGVQTVKVLTTHYTVTGAANPDGGTVTALVAPASTVRWTIYRDPAITQSVDLVENDPLPVETAVERPLDKLTMIAQRLAERINRSLRQPDGDTADAGALPAKVARATKVLAFDSNGDPVASTLTLTALEAPQVDAAASAVAAAASAATATTQASTATTQASTATTQAAAAVVSAAAAAASASVFGGTWTDLASATTTDLGAQTVANLRITGTVTITGFGTVASGIRRRLRFAASLTLTYNATSMILPGVASIVTQANDTCEALSLGSGNWIVVDYQRAAGTLSKVVVQTFIATGTYTPSAGMLYAIVEAVAGGGGGAGVPNPGASNVTVGGGGGSGGYARSRLTAAQIGASKAVTIGAAGAGGSAGANVGGSGGNTSLGTLVIVSGGTGGQTQGSGNPTYTVPGGAGGTVSAGDVQIPGPPGGSGFGVFASAMGGNGGSGPYGSGGAGGAAPGIAANGTAGAGFGSGGGGAACGQNGSSAAGGAGTAGLVIVTEFCE